MAAAKRWTSFQEDTRGYAVVEATILFPIIIMIFTGLVLLAMYNRFNCTVASLISFIL